MRRPPPTKAIYRALQRNGFVYDAAGSDDQVKLFVRFEKRGNSIVANGRLVGPRVRVKIEASYDLSEAQIEAMSMILPRLRRSMMQEGVSGRPRRTSKKERSKFRRWLNKLAKKIAKNKSMRKLRKARMKLAKSPIADMGIKAAASALQAYGVPPAATRMVLNQARATTIDRMAKGGWAGQVQRATKKGAKKGAFWKEEGLRHAQALPGSVMTALPGGKAGTKMLGGALGGLLKGVAQPGTGKKKGMGALQGALGGLLRGATQQGQSKSGVAPVADPAQGGDVRTQIRQAGIQEGTKALAGLFSKVGGDQPGYYHGAVGYDGAYHRGWHGY